MNGIAWSRKGAPTAQAEPPSAWLALGLLASALALQSIQGLPALPLPAVNFPLLAAVLTMVRCRTSVHAALYGALAGCAYDGLTHGPVGLRGIAWTIVGFVLPYVARRLRIHHAGTIACLCGVVFALQAALYSALESLLLPGWLMFELSWQIVPNAVLHSGLGMLLWLMLDRVTAGADRVLREARGAGDTRPSVPGAQRGRLRRPAAGILGHPSRER